MNRNFQTKRLLLDIVAVTDFDFINKLVNTEGWIEFIGDRNVHSTEDSVAYINKILDTPNFTYWIIRLRETNLPIGVISFIKRDYLKYFDIGFALLPNFQANGYAFEGAKEVLLQVTQNSDHPAIMATTIPHNLSSIKLLRKLGLQFNEEIEIENLKLHVYVAEKSKFLDLRNLD